MKGIPQGRYTKEFREEAVKLVTEEGLSWAEAARRLSLPTSTLANWVKAYNAGKLGDVGKTYRPLTDIEMELARTKKERAEVKMERDILKKAAAYFAKESLHVMRQSDRCGSITCSSLDYYRVSMQSDGYGFFQIREPLPTKIELNPQNCAIYADNLQ